MNKKIVIGIGVAAAAAVGYFFLKLLPKSLQLKESADNIKVELFGLPKIHKLDLSGLKISLDLKVDNPAQGRLNIKIPSVRAYYTPVNTTNRSLLASTTVSDKTYTIEPVSTGKISGIIIEVGAMNLLLNAPTIVKDYLAQGTKILDRVGFDVIAEVNGIPLKVQKL